MMVVRPINVPFIGAMMPSTMMILILFLGSSAKRLVFSLKNALYLMTLIISMLIGFINVDSNYERVWTWGLLLFNVLVVSSMTQFYVRTNEDLRRFTKYILAVCLVFSVSTIIGYLGYGDGIVIYNGINNDVSDDISVLYHSSRIYGITSSNLVQIISILFICVLPTLKIKNKNIEYLIIMIFICSGLVTLKRMTFIAMILSLFYYIQQQAKNKNYKAAFVIVVISLVLIDIWWEPIAYRFNIAGIGGQAIEDNSSIVRLDRINYAISIFKQSPLIGMGAGFVIFIHNGFYEILGNCGILGAMVIFYRYIPKLRDIIYGKPWAVVIILYLITCFALESAINQPQIIYFLGIFLGGYHVSKNIEINHIPKSK